MATERRWTIRACPDCGRGDRHTRSCRVPFEVIPVSVLRDEATVERVAEAIHDVDPKWKISWPELLASTFPKGSRRGRAHVIRAQARAALAVLIEQGAPDHTETKGTDGA